jgi:DNA-binding IclR family transcriptional regulator
VTKQSGERSERRIQSVEVGFRIVRVLETAPGKLALKDIAEAASLSPSSAYLYLSSFINVGLAVQDPGSGRYGLGPYAIQLGLAGLRQLDVLDVAREPLDALSAETGLSVFLSVWNNLGPTILLKADGARSMPLTLRIGSVLPPLESATGRVYVAHLPPAEVKTVFARLGQTVTDADIGAVVHDVRTRGVGLSDSRYFEDFAAMAAPVFGYAGEIAGAVTVLGSKTRIRAKDLTPALAKAAAAIGAALGHVRASSSR